MAKKKTEPVATKAVNKAEKATEYIYRDKAEIIPDLQKALGCGISGQYDGYTHRAMRRAYLQKGMTGKLVEIFQELLQIPITGEFDAVTEKAVKAVQKKNSIPVDGILNADTVKALFD